MPPDVTRWSADFEVSQLPVEQRHVICPFGYEAFASTSGLLCRTCFSGAEARHVAELPCACKAVSAPGKVRFVDGSWSADCSRCGRTWRGAHRLGEHGRWERVRPRALEDRPNGTRGPDWLFDSDLTITGTSSGSVTFLATTGMRASVSVALPDHPPCPGQKGPFSLSFSQTDEAAGWEIVPDGETRERLRNVIDQNIRERLAGAMRGEESLLRARGLVKYASRVFELLE